MAITDTVLRVPKRVARAGLLIGESIVETAPLVGPRLAWFAENLLAVNGITVEADPTPVNVAAFVLPAAKLVPVLAVLSRAPTVAIGPSLARVPGLGRVPCWPAGGGAGRLAGTVVLTEADHAELKRASSGLIMRVEVECTETPDETPGFLRAAARRTTHVRLRWVI